MHDDHHAENANRALGVKIREEIISAIGSRIMRDALSAICGGEAAVEISSFLPAWVTDAVLTDMETDKGWAEEHWVFSDHSDVELVPRKFFFECSPTQRFSWNDCLRKPSATAYGLRGFLSALTSPETSNALSSTFGERVKFKSADIARYSQAHYLRRHADLFEERRFGMVWFFSKNWEVSSGGELVVEASSGSSITIHPRVGTVAVLAIKPDYHHQVTAIRSPNWVRYSVASHYHAINATQSA